MRAAPLVVLFVLFALLPAQPAIAAGCAGGPAGDCLAQVPEWFAQPIDVSNVGATMEAGEPTACDGETVHRSVWLRLEVLSPGAPDPFELEFTAPFWMTAGAYTESDGVLTQVSCGASWEDEGMHSPTLYLPCEAGRVYWLQIGGQSASDVGTVHLYESQFWKFDQTLSAPCPFKPSLPGAPWLSPATPGANQVRLSWGYPAWDGGRSVSVSSYKVYRAPTCSGAFELLASTGSTAYTDGGLAEGAAYCYRVSAINPVGEGSPSQARAATVWTLPRAPLTTSAARGGDGELTISFGASPDASGPAPMSAYRIYRAPTAEGPFALAGSTMPTVRSFIDAGLGQGATWYYRVAAVNGAGEGPLGPLASATTWAVPGAPQDVDAQATLIGLPSVRVSWAPPVEATPFTHYRVYRATSPTATPELLEQVPSTTLSWLDEDAPLITDVHYVVRAYNPAGVSGASARACTAYPIESPLGSCG